MKALFDIERISYWNGASIDRPPKISKYRNTGQGAFFQSYFTSVEVISVPFYIVFKDYLIAKII